MSNQVRIEEYLMHSIFGAALGLVIGGSIAWWLADALKPYGWIVICSTTLFFALVGGVYRERLWKKMGDNPLFRIWSRLFP